jgi:hypothetical protein
MDRRTLKTSDFYEIGIYRLAGFEPDAVEKVKTNWGQNYGIAFYKDAEKMPDKNSFRVVWTDSQGQEQSAPLLSNLENHDKQSFASVHIDAKRRIFNLVDERK